MTTKRIVVCASGRGSNFRALCDAIQRQSITNALLVALLSDRPNSRAAAFAQEQGLMVKELDFASYGNVNRDEFDQALHETLMAWQPDLVLTLGYMRRVAAQTVTALAGRMINIHPSLLPAFKGLHAPRQALEYGVRFSGATTHFVDSDLDTGPIIGQRVVPVLPNDDEARLAQRILEQEHELLTKTVQHFCADRLKIEGCRVILMPAKS